MTPFLVKLDEHLGKAHLQLLREGSYDVDSVLGERLAGSSDEVLWSRVVADGRFLITLDLDFSDVRRFRPGTHPRCRLRLPRRFVAAVPPILLPARLRGPAGFLDLQSCRRAILAVSCQSRCAAAASCACREGFTGWH
jgi:hypothetical protein